MQLNQADPASDSRLRFVFKEKVVSFSLAADVTFGEVARTFDEFATQGYGNPVAIDVTLSRSRPGVERA